MIDVYIDIFIFIYKYMNLTKDFGGEIKDIICMVEMIRYLCGYAFSLSTRRKRKGKESQSKIT